MTVYALLSLLASMECLVMGVFVLTKSPREKLNILFAAMCLGVGLRAFIEFGYRHAVSILDASFWQSVDVFWPFASLFFFHFFIYFITDQAQKKNLVLRILMPVLYGIAAGLAFLEIFTDSITGSPRLEYWGWTYGPGTVPFAFLGASIFSYLLCISGTILFLIHSLKRFKNKTNRFEGIFLSISFAFIILAGILSEIVLPMIGINFPETTNIAIAIGFLPVAYLIWKNRLFEITPVRAVESIIGSMHDALILLNPDGGVKYLNPAAQRFLGVDTESPADLFLNSFISPEDMKRCALFIRGAEENVNHIEYDELDFISRSGERLPVSISLSRLFIRKNRQPIGFVCLARDISERKKRDDELARYQEELEELVRFRTQKLTENYLRYSTLFRDSPAALLEADLTRLWAKLAALRQGGTEDIVGFCMEYPAEAIRMLRLFNVIQVNTAFLQLFDVDSAEDFTKNAHRIFRKKSYLILIKIIETYFSGENELETGGIIYRPDGTQRFITLRLSFIAPGDGKPNRALFSIIDTTAQKLAEEERASIEEQLRHVQKMEALGTLAGGIAHDFNNLLSGILGYADLLKNNLPADSPFYHDIAVIEKTGLKAARLVRQLLNFARKGKRHNVAFDLQMIIDEVITILKHTIDKRITLIKRFWERPLFIQGDPGQIEQVIVNLAVNACDAMNDGGELIFETRVAVPDLRRMVANPHLKTEQYAELVVRDTGSGIPEAIRERVFEPFFTTKTMGKGTGMGLAVVYGIIANHEGTIEVEENEPKGSLFRVLLPLATQPVADLQQDDHIVKTGGEGKILIVDDEEVVRRVIERMLTTQGYTVSSVQNGEEAIDRYNREQEKIDLVLIDMIMPKMNGRDCFRALRTMNPDIKAVLITGHLPEGSAFEAVTEGMEDVIFKPFSRERLTQVIKSILHR